MGAFTSCSVANRHQTSGMVSESAMVANTTAAPNTPFEANTSRKNRANQERKVMESMLGLKFRFRHLYRIFAPSERDIDDNTHKTNASGKDDDDSDADAQQRSLPSGGSNATSALGKFPDTDPNIRRPYWHYRVLAELVKKALELPDVRAPTPLGVVERRSSFSAPSSSEQSKKDRAIMYHVHAIAMMAEEAKAMADDEEVEKTDQEDENLVVYEQEFISFDEFWRLIQTTIREFFPHTPEALALIKKFLNDRLGEEILQRYLKSKEYWRKLFNSYDEDHSGVLDENEFEPYIADVLFAALRPSCASDAEAAENVKQHMKSPTGRELVHKTFRKIDHDMDGNIVFDEFWKYIIDEDNLPADEMELQTVRLVFKRRNLPFVI